MSGVNSCLTDELLEFFSKMQLRKNTFTRCDKQIKIMSVKPCLLLNNSKEIQIVRNKLRFKYSEKKVLNLLLCGFAKHVLCFFGGRSLKPKILRPTCRGE